MLMFHFALAFALVRVFAASGIDVEAMEFEVQWGGEGEGDSQFDSPCGVAVDEEGRVFVCDRSNHRVQVFSKDGAFVRKVGTQGSEDGQFKAPVGVAVDEEHVFVADCDNDRVQVFTKPGVHVRTIGGVDEEHVYVGDFNNHRVQVFRKNGEFVRVLGQRGTGDGEFRNPTGVAVYGRCLYVGDCSNHRVQVFSS
jgi:tripartite motif-containing protein 71